MTSDGPVLPHSGIPLVFMEEGHALIALDEDGHLIHANKLCDRAHNIDMKLSCGSIWTGNARIDKTIVTMLEACRDYNDDDPVPMPAPVSATLSDGRTLHVDVFLVPRELGAAIDGARFMLVLRELEGRTKTRKQWLRKDFGLTVTEADLADLLVQGLSLKEVSKQLCISIWTVRSHLRAIFQKTGTHRQGELIAMINRKTR
ncbi:helix-turn-helix transcriptional regulator [Thalassovita mangrovi]|uniref:HTH luxR-type domain-containing protein n=1 Tax=Thalassovita mangrovi TaxID=2692236 RepID=A0A6L8LDD8_9RHOB|nr:helix-turn-helix transcriptional regulator [Thalassovita mangrovi]MYM54087.1 hypothetical protein [Thalassovita mangrovi]